MKIRQQVPHGLRCVTGFEISMKYDLIIRPEAESEMTGAYACYEKRAIGLGNHIAVLAVFHAKRYPTQWEKRHS
jgi:hypothetical protein